MEDQATLRAKFEAENIAQLRAHSWADVPEDGVYLYLHHGRFHPDETLNDWGFDGPFVGPLDFAHVTYMTSLGLRFTHADDDLAYETGPMFGEDEGAAFSHDMLYFLGAYYGDWTVAHYKADLPARLFDFDGLETYRVEPPSESVVEPAPVLRYWVVTGRIPEDDDDTLLVFHAATREEAVGAFEEELYSLSCYDEHERADIVSAYGEAVYIINVAVSDSQIKEA